MRVLAITYKSAVFLFQKSFDGGIPIETLGFLSNVMFASKTARSGGCHCLPLNKYLFGNSTVNPSVEYQHVSHIVPNVFVHKLSAKNRYESCLSLKLWCLFQIFLATVVLFRSWIQARKWCTIFHPTLLNSWKRKRKSPLWNSEGITSPPLHISHQIKRPKKRRAILITSYFDDTNKRLHLKYYFFCLSQLISHSKPQFDVQSTTIA